LQGLPGKRTDDVDEPELLNLCRHASSAMQRGPTVSIQVCPLQLMT
jgi:hypothetical protein